MSKKPVNTSQNSAKKVSQPNEPAINKANRWDIAFVQLLAVSSFLRLLFAVTAGLKYEEAYYWNYGQHLALSYFDHPPMVGWLIRLFTGIAGQQEIWVRLPAIILFIGTVMCLHSIAKTLFDSRTAFWTAVVVMLLPAFEWYSIIVLPDAPLLFFWAFGMFCGLHLIRTEKPLWWLGIGVATGLGMLSKYPAVLIPVGPLLVIACHKRWHLVKNLSFAGACALAIVIFSPVLVWNSQHEWASLLYQGVGRFGESNSLTNRLGGSLLNQVLLLSPGGFVALAWAIITSLKRYREEQYEYLLASCVPFLALMLLLSCVRLVQMNWPLPGYLAAVIILVARLIEVQAWQRRRWLLAIIFVPALIIAASPWIATMVPVGALNRADDFSGWEPMAKAASEARLTMPNPEKTFLAGHGYQLASELAYYAQAPELTLSRNILGEDAKGYNYWKDPQTLKGWDAIYVVYEEISSNGEWKYRVSFDYELLKAHFTKVDNTADKVTAFRGGKPLRRYRVYRCYGYLGLQS